MLDAERGHPVLLFYVMPAVNLFAVAALAGLGAWTALVHGRSGWWGFVLPLGVNAGLSLTHNFTDCISTLAVFGLLSTWLRRGSWWSVTLWAGAAVFAREQNALVIGIVGLSALWQGRRSAAAGIGAVAILWGGWVALLWTAYGAPPWVSDGQNLAQPLSGLVYRFQHLGDTGQRISVRLGILHLASTLHLIVLLGAGVWALRRAVPTEIALLLAGGIALTLLTGWGVYVDFSSYLRVFVWVPLGLWLACLATGQRLADGPAYSWPVVVSGGHCVMRKSHAGFRDPRPVSGSVGKRDKPGSIRRAWPDNYNRFHTHH